MYPLRPEALPSLQSQALRPNTIVDSRCAPAVSISFRVMGPVEGSICWAASLVRDGSPSPIYMTTSRLLGQSRTMASPVPLSRYSSVFSRARKSDGLSESPGTHPRNVSRTSLLPFWSGGALPAPHCDNLDTDNYGDELGIKIG